jgi:hypothetical protein
VIITTNTAKLVKAVELVCDYDSLFLKKMSDRFGGLCIAWGGAGDISDIPPSIDSFAFYSWKYRSAAIQVNFDRSLGLTNKVLGGYVIVSFYKPRVEANEK